MEEKPSIFRKEALEFYQHHRRQEGDLLRLAPAWTGATYWLVVIILVVAVLFSLVGTIKEYASGPALIRVVSRTDVSAPAGGVVASVEVQPGQRVVAGQPLVVLQSETEHSTVARVQQEMELLLVRYMRNPSDQSAREALTALRAEQGFAQSQLEARSLRAPVAGIVGDVRVQAGQYLQPGTSVASVEEADSPVYLQAFLPGSYRPYLRAGMSLRVELEGFHYDYQELTIESVGDQVIGPAELKRYLGPDLGDSIPIEGPIVLVRARMASRTFTHQGQVLGYFNGMPGRAEVAVRSEPIFLTLIPGLKALYPHDG